MPITDATYSYFCSDLYNWMLLCWVACMVCVVFNVGPLKINKSINKTSNWQGHHDRIQITGIMLIGPTYTMINRPNENG